MPLIELLPGSHTGPAAGAKGSVHSGGLSVVGRKEANSQHRGWNSHVEPDVLF